MIDRSYFVPLLPGASDLLDVYKANAIEENLRYLIRQWPAFEVETIRGLIGDYGTVFVPSTASPAQGAEVTLLQRLPRFFVIVEGDTGYMTWAGSGWAAEDEIEGGVMLFRAPDTADEKEANEALRGLVLGATWNADLTVSLGARRADGTLEIVRPSVTKILFRAEITWGRLGRERKNWAALKAETWEQVRELKKE